MANYAQVLSENLAKENNFASYGEPEFIDLTRSPLPLSCSSAIIDLTKLSDLSRSSSTSSKIIDISFRPISSDEVSSSSPFPTIRLTAAVAAVATIDEDELIGRRIQEEIITDFLAHYVYEIEVENAAYCGGIGG